ncbi:hypothetical protein ACWGPZ_31065, partial [Priestia megaterium]
KKKYQSRKVNKINQKIIIIILLRIIFIKTPKIYTFNHRIFYTLMRCEEGLELLFTRLKEIELIRVKLF